MRSERRDSSAAKIAVRGGSGPDKPIRRTFPGPRGVEVALRVAIERRPYADLLAHAKEALDVEVCGVLAGQLCEDEDGLFVQVEAIIRGTSASHGATHVTFTQATWDAIHQTLERDHKGRRIVGWYHTHPGFGVEFSDMDLFIQRNFFSGPGQIAFVSDPMKGTVAIAVNSGPDVAYLNRFWVDGREQPAIAPATPSHGQPTAVTATVEGQGSSDVAALEARIGQLIQAQDDLRTLLYRFVYGVGFLLVFAIIATFGYIIYNQYTSRLEPPRLTNFVPVPVQLGNKTMLIGVGVAQWEVPPELDAMMIKIAKEKAADDQKAAGKAAAGEPKVPAIPAPSTSPASEPTPAKQP